MLNIHRNETAAVTIPTVQVLCHLAIAVMCSVVLLTLSGCSKRYSDLPAYSPLWFGEYSNESVGRFKTTYIATQIDDYYRGAAPGPIGIATFVNLDDLYHTSSFGRMLSEQLMSELAMRGFEVIELRHSDALQFLETAGELALSRDITAVRHERQLGGVVVGTYVVSPIRVYVNARLIDPTTSLVLSAGSVEMSKTDEIARLLRGGGSAPTLERIPVRHLGFSTYPAAAFSNPMARVWDIEESTPPQPSMNTSVPAARVSSEKKGEPVTVVEPKIPDLKSEGAGK
jgi:TolB-like protein